MKQTDSSSEKLFASIHRSILGILLATAGIVTLSTGLFSAIRGSQNILDANILIGTGFLLLGFVLFAITIFIVYWIYQLFLEGIEEGRTS